MRSKHVVPLVLGMARAWKRSARNSLRLVFGRAARARRRRSVRAHGMPQMLHMYLALCDATLVWDLLVATPDFGRAQGARPWRG